jgi:hypothetical protein
MVTVIVGTLLAIIAICWMTIVTNRYLKQIIQQSLENEEAEDTQQKLNVPIDLDALGSGDDEETLLQE